MTLRTYLLPVPDGRRKHIASRDNSYPPSLAAPTLCGLKLEHYKIMTTHDSTKVCPACAKAAI